MTRWNTIVRSLLAVLVPLILAWWTTAAPEYAAAEPTQPYPLVEQLSLDDVVFRQHREVIVRDDDVRAPLAIVAYRVRAGDSIAGIAAAFGLPTATLVSLNRLESGRPGTDTLLLIPNKAALFIPGTSRSLIERELQYLGSSSREEVQIVLPAEGATAFRVVPVDALPDSEPAPEGEGLRRPVGAPLFAAPLASISVSSPFGPRRHPFTGEWRDHDGVDLRAPHGADVFAARSGRVTAIERDQWLGLSITIDHDDGYTTRYAHLREALVRVGETVGTGQTVARSGSTGYSTGAHLHFEIRLDGTPLNPLDFLVTDSDL